MKRKRVVLLLGIAGLVVVGLVLGVGALNWHPVRSNHLIRQSPAGTNVFGFRTFLSTWRLSGQQQCQV